MRGLLFCISLLILLGCNGKKKSSREVLPQEKMEKLLWDLTLADEYVTVRQEKDSALNNKQERIRLYQQVFQIHQTNKEQVSLSLKYYMGHPDVFKVMYDSIASRAQHNRYQPQKPKDFKSE